MIIHIPLTLQTNNMKTYAITSIIIVSRSGLDSSEYTSNYGSDRDSDGRHTQQKYHSQMRDSGGRNKPIITQESSYSSQSYSNDPNRPTSNVRNTDSSIHQRKHGTNPAEQQRTQFNQFYNTSTASVDAVDNAGMAHFHQIGQLDCCCCCGAIVISDIFVFWFQQKKFDPFHEYRKSRARHHRIKVVAASVQCPDTISHRCQPRINRCNRTTCTKRRNKRQMDRLKVSMYIVRG